MINLDHAKKAFDNYVNRYDLSIPHIHLKYVHSYKVMDVMGELCDMKEKTEERTAGTAQGSKAPGKRNRKTGRCSG